MKPISRRKFLKKTALATSTAPLVASAFSFPFISSAGAQSANDRIHLGVIGCGGMGRGDLDHFLRNQDVACVVLCDIDDAQIGQAMAVCESKGVKKPETAKDFRQVLDRKDVDAVLIATPDHWHALPTVMACQAGKDVYVEKPLAKTIAEGRAMLEASRKHNRVAQMGSQWRSCKHIIDATNFIHSGKLGKVSLARGWAYLDWLPSIGHKPDGQPPAGVDYNMWLGPAPEHAFNPNRFHFNFRWFWDYAGGLMTDWGVHLINMMLMGMSSAPPKSAFSTGGKFVFDDDSETPDSQVAVFEFPDYMLIWEHKAGLGNGLNNRSWGIEWSGTEGCIILNDEGWEIRAEPKRGNIDSHKYPGSGDPRPAHIRNFLDCVKSREQPVLNLEKGHHVSTVAHLGNIAYRTGRKITWNAEKERIEDDPGAAKLATVKYRQPWSLPYLETEG